MDASTISESERTALGITTALPKSISESLAALENDKEMQGLIGPEFSCNYAIVKRAESEKLNAMSEDERRMWLVEQY